MSSPEYQRIQYFVVMGITVFLTTILAAMVLWMWEKRRDGLLRQKELAAQHDLEAKRLQLEEQKIEADQEREERRLRAEDEREERRQQAEESARYDVRKLEEEKIAAATGSGGYIFVDMAETERPLFHDLLKGFEDYARLKGYQLAFSIDSATDGRIAFKFTIKNDGFVVGPERVRQDFKEYVEQVRNKDLDLLDQMPVIASLEEHNLLVTHLKNRILFLQHSYSLSQNAVLYYQNLISNVRTFPALPAANVIVHTGGQMDQRSYSAVNSQKVLQGDNSTLSDSSINIGQSFNERSERISTLDGVIARLAQVETADASVVKAQKELGKVRDEMVDEPTPDPSSIQKWMENAKNALKTAALGYEVTEAAHKLFTLFGLS